LEQVKSEKYQTFNLPTVGFVTITEQGIVVDKVAENDP